LVSVTTREEQCAARENVSALSDAPERASVC